MLHIKTPLIYSPILSRLIQTPVYLKLENLQPSGSFKIRGIGLTCSKAKEQGFKQLVGSSGGNAGLAMAYAANQLEMPLTLFIPTSTPQMMVDLIKAEQVEVVVTGQNWNEANAEAQTFLQSHPDAFFVHPYDQNSTWQGHASIVEEIEIQLKTEFKVEENPDAIVTCVGGGGLAIGKSRFVKTFVENSLPFCYISGLCLGMEKVGWKGKTSLITMETDGSNCFNQALKEGRIVTLNAIKSIAKSLGALSVSSKLFELATQTEHKIHSKTVTDAEALKGKVNYEQLVLLSTRH